MTVVFSVRNDRYVPELGRASAIVLVMTLLAAGAMVVWPGLFYWVAFLFLSWIVMSTVFLIGVPRTRQGGRPVWRPLSMSPRR